MTEKSGMIPVCDLAAQFRACERDIRAAIDRVLARSWFILGEELRVFEEEFARAAGAPYAVGVASGTDAIHLALRAVGLHPGDKVLTAPSSTVPTAAGIVQAGGVPAFADVDPRTGLLTLDAVERACTEEVKAIVPVHLYGRCVPLDGILELARRRGIPVIEDAAQAHGAADRGRPAGTMGAVGCFSFYPSKNLGAYGDAGACVTADPDLAARLRRLRNYGEEGRYRSIEFGVNSRCDEMQAAILRAKLPRLAEWNARRREIASEYGRRLAGLPLLLPPGSESPFPSKGASPAQGAFPVQGAFPMQGALPGQGAFGKEGGGGTQDGSPAAAGDGSVEVFHLFVVQAARRDDVRSALAERGVGTQIHYPIPIHLQPAYAWLGLGPGSFPAAEKRAGRLLTLPLYPEMTSGQIDHVCAALAEVLRGAPPPEEP